MEMPRLNKSVRKVVKLQRDEDGTLVPTVIYKGAREKRKVSSALRPSREGHPEACQVIRPHLPIPI